MSALGCSTMSVGRLSSLGKYPRSGAALFIGITLLLSYTLRKYSAPVQRIYTSEPYSGTIMAANVWLRILPGQKRMVQAVQEEREPDMSFGVQGKNRSRHNTYMAFPLVFMMVATTFRPFPMGMSITGKWSGFYYWGLRRDIC
ncbi:MAG: urate hydroxylase PuuD [Myxococcota bacterium]